MTSKKLSIFQVQEFERENKSIIFLLDQASEEYISARCLLINGFFPGLVLAAQSVEKFLKSLILINDNNADLRGYSHHIDRILDKVIRLYNFDLHRFRRDIKNLKKHYQNRYPDNVKGTYVMSTTEIKYIDDLVITLNRYLPFPEEIKYRNGLYNMICKESTRDFQKWATMHNDALDFDALKSRHTEVQNQLRTFY
ncbi:HEPN domain-containing protein [Neobacillus drentensis]|uniref:HEPN domain-containing protein n=1 Tax=Neobacillus drentensis TaxID=220684 RepID=UPI00286B9E3F|nr:HEPN domain-containing protein [Neobacillus drentensis]